MIFRAQIGFPFDSTFPRDVITMNPHYQGDNPQALADALKTNLTNSGQLGANMPFKIKIYDAEKPAPNYPIADAENGTGYTVTNFPREIALCLSYYSTYNRPSYRGRLFVPFFFVGGPLGLRPTQTQQLNVLTFANTFGSNLPNQHTWSVYSKKMKRAWTISDAWCDNEWDTVRSRGLRPENREVVSVP
uniref:Uncharacterized protein n=1 Tax=uncultured prokaryote TaxID=198431 RepID=A0A0H5Q586_9ZZZZ|nr:hypothetical protein [uncultured prokaryote]